ncbi:head maturation protease, ClpP-related [Cytobacillus firmus]|uniref:head maturation protease, ClpP-related n=1 Tax=Cytobacillus firmus TaxID=1399 RepID=UPI001F5496DD|nr:head maturation protease, ClpP-related [Cytobacillus firmus]
MKFKNMKRFKNEKYNAWPEINHSLKAEASDNGDSTKITIYGDIGESRWGESVSASDVERILKDVTTNTIHVHINSFGGDAFDGIAIYNQLKNHEAKIIIHVDGLAASAASLIVMAGDEVIMNTGAMLMIHEASTFAWGTKADIRKTLNALEGIDKSIADIYMTRFKGERSEIDTLIANETWFTSDEAVEFGLADSLNENADDEEDDVDVEEIKNSILNRLRNQNPPMVASQENKSILNRFKRQS